MSIAAARDQKQKTTRSGSRFSRFTAAFASLALVVTALVAGVATAEPAAAAITIQCGDGAGTADVYALTNSTTTGNLALVTGSSGAGTYLATISPQTSNSTSLNALGINSDGSYLYAIGGTIATTANGTSSFYVVTYNASTAATTYTALSSPVNTASNSTVARGAVNPANGYYYYTIGTSSYQDLYAFNPSTSTSTIIGRIANVSTNPNSGDLTFDQDGNMYIVMGAYLKVVGNVPSTGSSTTILSATTLVTSIGGNSSLSANGIAFARSGLLYVTASSTIYGINATTGSQVSSNSISLGTGLGGTVSDLATCQNPNTLTLKKNVSSRYASTDQFTTSIAATGITTVTGTTTGTDTGLQEDSGEFAGPVVATSGLTYTLSETMASGSLSNYATTYSCTDASGTSYGSGTGTSFTLTYPSSSSGGLAITCIFTNSASVLDTTKTVSTVNGVAATSDTILRPGDVVVYKVVTTNTGGASGTTTLTETVPTDTTYTGSGEGWTCAATTAGSDCTLSATVAAGSSVTSSFTVTVGSSVSSSTTTIANTVASSAGTCSSCTASNAIYDPKLTLEKTASPTTATAAGQTVTYSFLVTNTGNVAISGLAVTETAFTGQGTAPTVTCSVTTLAAEASTTCTATYTVTQADINAGTAISNTAKASGVDPSSTAVTSNESTATVTPTQAPELTLDKSVSPSTVTAAGTEVTYTFTVSNSGNVPISELAISESAFGGSGTLSAITCAETSLAVEGSTTCTATYAVTQADIDAGGFTNTATATGTDLTDTTVTSNESSAAVTAESNPSLSMVKSADVMSVDAVGEVITYTFLVTNTGNVTVDNIAIDETLFTGSGELSDIECDETTLAPDATTECTATYAVTRADLNAGDNLLNTAKATGLDPDDEDVESETAGVSIEVIQNPSLSVVKSADVASVDGAGDEITYTFTVTNTGNVTVGDIAIDETSFSGTGVVSDIECDDTTLVAGASTECTATYTVTQADIDAGEITNAAVATGTDPNDDDVTSDESEITVDVDQTSSLSLVKSASVASVDDAGDVITYTFTVANTGNTTITDLTIAEGDFSGTGDVSEVTCAATSLAPDATTKCTATYTVTQAEIDAGDTITNTATATGVAPGDVPITSNDYEADVAVVQDSSLSVVKSADAAEVMVSAVGEEVTYSFLVTNTGNTTVTGVTIVEGDFSGTGTL
ncbi:MAG: hypothetical protein QM622_10370, partial [Microbacterium sp.]